MRRRIFVLALSLLFGAAYWILDSIYAYLTFADGLRARLFQEPLTLADAIYRNVPPDDLLSRSMFLLACLVGGLTVIFFLRRDDAKDRALRASEERFRFLSDAAFEAIVIHDRERIIHANRAFERMFGFHADGMESERVLQRIVGPEQRDAVRRRMQDLEPGPYETEGMDADGVRFPMDVNAVNGTYQGRRVRTVALRDATRRKESERRLRQLSAQVLRAQEQERMRLGRELHDSTAQSLGAIKLLFENELARLREAEPGLDLGTLPDIVEYIRNAIDEVRRIVMNLRPTMLDDLGLESALKWLSRELAHLQPGLRIQSLVLVPEAELNEGQRTVLYRVAQEALTNVVRHGRASSASVLLERKDGGLRLCVEDDGVGFDPEQVSREHVGLASMTERVELLGGRLKLDTAPGRGTRVVATLPES